MWCSRRVLHDCKSKKVMYSACSISFFFCFKMKEFIILCFCLLVRLVNKWKCYWCKKMEREYKPCDKWVNGICEIGSGRRKFLELPMFVMFYLFVILLMKDLLLVVNYLLIRYVFDSSMEMYCFFYTKACWINYFHIILFFCLFYFDSKLCFDKTYSFWCKVPGTDTTYSSFHSYSWLQH